MNDFKKNIVLLSDSRVAAIPVLDSEEPFDDLLHGNCPLQVDRSRSQIGNHSPYFACVRTSIGQRLVEAQESLPHGLQLFVKEGFRPASLQRSYYERYLRKLSASRAEWTSTQLREAASAYIAPPELAPHSTGGAVDLTLIDLEGHECEMGSVFNIDPQTVDFVTYTDAPYISSEAKRNRTMLRKCMEGVGFVNYPTEWWHWSYGDRYWAHVKNERYAIYGGVETPRIKIE